MPPFNLQAWRLKFHASRRKNDLVCVAQFVCSIAICFQKFGLAGLGSSVAFFLISVLISAVLAALAFRPSFWYLKNRSAVILAYQSTIVIALTLIVFPSPFYWQQHPLGLASTLTGRLKSLLLSPFFIFQVRFAVTVI